VWLLKSERLRKCTGLDNCTQQSTTNTACCSPRRETRTFAQCLSRALAHTHALSRFQIFFLRSYTQPSTLAVSRFSCLLPFSLAPALTLGFNNTFALSLALSVAPTLSRPLSHIRCHFVSAPARDRLFFFCFLLSVSLFRSRALLGSLCLSLSPPIYVYTLGLSVFPSISLLHSRALSLSPSLSLFLARLFSLALSLSTILALSAAVRNTLNPSTVSLCPRRLLCHSHTLSLPLSLALSLSLSFELCLAHCVSLTRARARALSLSLSFALPTVAFSLSPSHTHTHTCLSLYLSLCFSRTLSRCVSPSHTRARARALSLSLALPVESASVRT